MENMARLWLQQEVHDLEGKGSGGGSKGTFKGFAHYSPYIVVDHFALSAHFNLVKEVVASKKFAVIIPTAVIQELDGLKKNNSGARNAIRWLEKQFHDGNRWLRPQRVSEVKPLELISYPKRKQKEAWTYFQIIECCHHFATVRGEASMEQSVQVTLLTADAENQDQTEQEQPEVEDGGTHQGQQKISKKKKNEGTDVALVKTFDPKVIAESISKFYICMVNFLCAFRFKEAFVK